MQIQESDLMIAVLFTERKYYSKPNTPLVTSLLQLPPIAAFKILIIWNTLIPKPTWLTIIPSWHSIYIFIIVELYVLKNCAFIDDKNTVLDSIICWKSAKFRANGKLVGRYGTSVLAHFVSVSYHLLYFYTL